MRLIGSRSLSLWDVIETGDDGTYRSVYPDDGMSTDAANHGELKIFWISASGGRAIVHYELEAMR